MVQNDTREKKGSKTYLLEFPQSDGSVLVQVEGHEGLVERRVADLHAESLEHSLELALVDGAVAVGVEGTKHLI